MTTTLETPVDPSRMTYAMLKPYDTPDSLDDLHGPTTGVIRVAPNINTSPRPVYDLDNPDRLRMLYMAVLGEGYTDQQVALLDKATLVRLWPDLFLPIRCRQIWEAKFPELLSTAHVA